MVDKGTRGAQPKKFHQLLLGPVLGNQVLANAAPRRGLVLVRLGPLRVFCAKMVDCAHCRTLPPAPWSFRVPVSTCHDELFVRGDYRPMTRNTPRDDVNSTPAVGVLSAS